MISHIVFINMSKFLAIFNKEKKKQQKKTKKKTKKKHTILFNSHWNFLDEAVL